MTSQKNIADTGGEEDVSVSLANSSINSDASRNVHTGGNVSGNFLKNGTIKLDDKGNNDTKKNGSLSKSVDKKSVKFTSETKIRKGPSASRKSHSGKVKVKPKDVFIHLSILLFFVIVISIKLIFFDGSSSQSPGDRQRIMKKEAQKRLSREEQMNQAHNDLIMALEYRRQLEINANRLGKGCNFYLASGAPTRSVSLIKRTHDIGYPYYVKLGKTPLPENITENKDFFKTWLDRTVAVPLEAESTIVHIPVYELLIPRHPSYNLLYQQQPQHQILAKHNLNSDEHLFLPHLELSPLHDSDRQSWHIVLSKLFANIPSITSYENTVELISDIAQSLNITLEDEDSKITETKQKTKSKVGVHHGKWRTSSPKVNSSQQKYDRMQKVASTLELSRTIIKKFDTMVAHLLPNSLGDLRRVLKHGVGGLYSPSNPYQYKEACLDGIDPIFDGADGALNTIIGGKTRRDIEIGELIIAAPLYAVYTHLNQKYNLCMQGMIIHSKRYGADITFCPLSNAAYIRPIISELMDNELNSKQCYDSGLTECSAKLSNAKFAWSKVFPIDDSDIDIDIDEMIKNGSEIGVTGLTIDIIATRNLKVGEEVLVQSDNKSLEEDTLNVLYAQWEAY